MNELKTCKLDVAYQLGRVDALTGEQPSRYTASPWPNALPVPEGHCGCTKAEAKIWSEMKNEYQRGYNSTVSQFPDMVNHARQTRR